MAMTVMYNGVQFAPISVKQSIVVSCPAEVLWSVVGKFGTMALWMGSVAGQPIFSQLLVRLHSTLAEAVVGSFQYISNSSQGCQAKLIQSRDDRTECPQGTRIMLQGGVSADFVGSVRVFGIADKLLFDQLTRMDNQEMVM